MDTRSRRERERHARVAAYDSWAQTSDRTARTQAARQAFMGKFEKEVDPHQELDPDERHRRAEAAKRAHFSRMALKSHQTRGTS